MVRGIAFTPGALDLERRDTALPAKTLDLGNLVFRSVLQLNCMPTFEALAVPHTAVGCEFWENVTKR
jgi:hypothetical protein